MRQPHEIHCTQCGRSYVVHVEPADIAKWRAGELIQRAMPYLTPDEREILMSGVCGACFDRMFKEKALTLMQLKIDDLKRHTCFYDAREAECPVCLDIDAWEHQAALLRSRMDEGLD